MMKSAYRMFAAITVLAVAPGIAHAQSQAARQACRGDFRKFCADTAPGGGRIAACLKENTDKLSSECKDALKTSASK
jgi:uncharacterized membrane protein